MTAKFASLHGDLLARKGLATPATLPLPVMRQLVRPRFRDVPAPARNEQCCGGAAGDDAVRVPAAFALHPVYDTKLQHAMDLDAPLEIGAELRTQFRCG